MHRIRQKPFAASLAGLRASLSFFFRPHPGGTPLQCAASGKPQFWSRPAAINTPEKSASTTITGLTALLVALSVLRAGLAHAQSITAMGSSMPSPFPTPAPGTHVATVTGALRVGTTAAQGTLTIAGGAILNASSNNAANAPVIFRNGSQMTNRGRLHL